MAASEESFSASRLKTGGKGRPKVDINFEQLKSLFDQNFSAVQMSHIFKCSTKVVRRRLAQCGLKLKERFTHESDHQLDAEIRKLKEQFPNSGSVMMKAYLQGNGINVQRDRVRTSLQRVDPEGVKSRWRQTIKRRSYKVATPNSFWHMDAHMKLIRWGFATHGCIDGYSRLIPYLRCALDSKAKTVLRFFVPACSQYGIPSKVRSDKGGENMMVALFMNLVRGLDRGSHVTGRSVHNSRIERLWRDVFVQVISRYHSLFSSFEEDPEINLNPDNDVHRAALHFLYLNEINTSLETFRQAWNTHSLSSEGNKSPLQIWTSGMLENIGSSHAAVQGMFHEAPQSLHETIEESLAKYNLSLNDLGTTPDDTTESTPLSITSEQRAELTRVSQQDATPEARLLSVIDKIMSW